MNKTVLLIVAVYFAVVSLLSTLLTVIDKRCAVTHRRRIPERTLLLVAFFGGSLTELITMKIIRHKTLHKKFMIGLPVMIVLQLLIVAAVLLWRYGVIPVSFLPAP